MTKIIVHKRGGSFGNATKCGIPYTRIVGLGTTTPLDARVTCQACLDRVAKTRAEAQARMAKILRG